MKKVNILAFAGSLRKDSYNKAALRAAQQLVPKGVVVTIFDLAGIPLFNEDVQKKGFPKRVQEFRKAISKADALLIATPEYNHAISGVLKNALDWASRKDAKGNKVLAGKPVAIMGASDGGFGTARAQVGLSTLANVLNMHLLVGHNIYISKAQEQFNQKGELVNDKTKQLLIDMLVALREWTLKLK